MKNLNEGVIFKFFSRVVRFKKALFAFKEMYGINPLRRIVIFDVGANDGGNFLDIVKLPWVTVHAFEPTPDLIQVIQKRVLGRSNYILNEVAISDEDGMTNFNVAGQGDWGCSSILDFSENINETWKDRDDLVFTKTIEVKTIKLSSYVRMNGIKRIDLLHVDIQGYDLVALRSLGEFIGIVKKGVVEVPMNEHVKLYIGQHTKDEMLSFLEDNNFKIRKITPQQNEENIFFEHANYIA